MTISTTWSVSQCNREVSTGKIISADVVCKATDPDETGVTGEANASVDFSGDVTIAYADVTEADVVGWAKSALGTDQVSEMESAAEDIFKAESSSNAYGLPWVTD